MYVKKGGEREERKRGKEKKLVWKDVGGIDDVFAFALQEILQTKRDFFSFYLSSC